HHHATQTRLTKIVSTNEYGEIESEWYARADDCDEIMEILLQDFDPLCDQLPERDELLDRIASVIMFKRGAAVADWIFWVTRPEERKTFLGSMLREKYLELTGKVRRQITYTRKPNMKLFHTQVGGMQPDGFENRILVLEK
ncbi:MAG: hypothetical protein IJU71_08950, partial [Selenomonadaceae bacterium]|nr:hypothetical protein [Selenomonadaceae bacterium]